MLSAPLTAFVNHVLATATWAKAILAEHAGKVAVVEMFPVRLAVAVEEGGFLKPAAADAEPAVTIRVTHAVALLILAEGEEAWRKADVQGDTAFAAAIAKVAANLKWDVEEDLSKVVGDIAAQRIAAASRAASAWPRQAAAGLAANAAEFLSEEAKVLVTPLRAAEFVRDVDELRDAVERLDKRIARIEQRARGG